MAPIPCVICRDCRRNELSNSKETSVRDGARLSTARPARRSSQEFVLTKRARSKPTSRKPFIRRAYDDLMSDRARIRLTLTAWVFEVVVEKTTANCACALYLPRVPEVSPRP